MVYEAVTDPKEIKRAVVDWRDRMKATAVRYRRRVGYQGGGAECELYWRSAEGVWSLFDFKKEKSRYWCCFGTTNPEDASSHAITCEINPSKEGVNLNCAGLILRDGDGQLHLGHTGKVGGGKKGISKSEFLKWRRGDLVQVVVPGRSRPYETIIVGALDARNLPGKVAAFVHEVERFKAGRPPVRRAVPWLDRPDGRRRWDAWKALGKPHPEKPVTAAALKACGLYGGGRGVWTDKKHTAQPGYEEGIAVSVYHTESKYPDELGEKSALYHYPVTGQPGKDAQEIAALRNAKDADVPVLFIRRPQPSSTVRLVKWAWVVGEKVEFKHFVLRFSEARSAGGSRSDGPFNPYQARKTTKVLTEKQKRDPKFRSDVFQRYGVECGVCGIKAERMLEAAHIVAKSCDGSDDPQNGLVLCGSHHKALDANLFSIRPSDLTIEVHSPHSSADLRMERDSLKHLKKLPHRDALKIAYKDSKGR